MSGGFLSYGKTTNIWKKGNKLPLIRKAFAAVWEYLAGVSPKTTTKSLIMSVRAKKKPTKDQIIYQLIDIAHELDWACFWNDTQRHKKALAGLEEVKHIVKWRELQNGAEKNRHSNALSLYNRALFWEYSEREIQHLPPEFVIPRVTRYGSLNDIIRLFCIYDPYQILDVVHKDKELSSKEKTFLNNLALLSL